MEAYDLYYALRRVLPRRFFYALGGSRLFAPLRDRFLRPGGTPALTTREIQYDGKRFSFTASYSVLARAQQRGIENTICRLLRQRARPGALAIDVGANFGFVSCTMSIAGMQVVALEMDGRILPTLRRNLAAFDAVVIEARVGNGSNGSLRLDDLVSGSPSLVKIDTDGDEVAVLEGAVATLRRSHPTIIVESNGRQAELVLVLRSVGYQRFTGLHGESYVDAQNILAEAIQ